MKCPSGSPGGRDPWAPPPGSGSGSGGGGGSSEPAKKQQRTASSSRADEATTSSSPQPPPQPPGPAPDGGDVPYLGEDLMFEVLRRAEARTLASAACVSRGWRALAQDERLWEAACVREWADLGFSEQQLRAVVLSLGGFRRLHAVSIRPIQRRRAGAPPAQGRGRRQQPPARLGRDQVQLSLSLFSIGFFQNMPSRPPPKKKDEGDGSDKGGGGQCG
uniref:F-box protein GID2 n=1 Tax=Hordeum vulgare subsp. vulgare TaxID=112509 RepID=F2ELY3_HORVV|nr:predicted protein [Hordeum vulgare subsp. vulgare]